MPICKICNKLIKPLGMPVGIVERMEVELRQIVSDVNYSFFHDTPNYPVPVVPLIVEFYYSWLGDGMTVGIIIWKEPCVGVKDWTCHAPSRPQNTADGHANGRDNKWQFLPIS